MPKHLIKMARASAALLKNCERLYRASRAAASAAMRLFAPFIRESGGGPTVVIAQQARKNQGLKICFRANHWKSRRKGPI
jgi:hypothetical protein